MTTETSARRSVLQDWVAELTMMQQSVLLTAVRGPDGLPKYHPVKYLLRWYRRCILLSSFEHRVLDNPAEHDGGSFLGPSVDMGQMACSTCLVPAANHVSPRKSHQFTTNFEISYAPLLDDRVTAYIAALDEVPHHFQLHLLHAAEVVGYKHPDPDIASWWRRDVYLRLVHDMHLFPEVEPQMDARLGDDRAGWLARGDVATNA